MAWAASHREFYRIDEVTMIEVKDKKDCCGCSACAQICPKQCIQMRSDDEGFDYPFVDTARCIDCGRCDKVCPIQNAGVAKRPLKVYASKNRDEEVRQESSSGGVFTLLAESVLNRGGVVFGVSFDKDWNAVHSYAESRDGLAAFRGSKYVQSRIGTSYADVKKFLKEGREVLFSGTPCQIAGLRRFLGGECRNLLTVEILCHGVPSPAVWKRYLDCKKKEYRCGEISRINFRSKGNGWHRYSVTMEFKDGTRYERFHKRDPYFKYFLKNLYLRPSCYACRCKNGRADSDIVIADYWNIKNVLPEYDDDKGVSLMLINTERGLSLLASVASGIDCVETGYDECIQRNGGFSEHISVHKGRWKFFRKLVNGGAETFPVESGLLERVKSLMKRVAGK